MDYFKEQIAIFKIKSIESLRKAQEFAIDQDLSVLQGETEIDKEIPNVINIEAIRVEASNQIRVIDQQLVQIQDLQGDKSEQIMYVASTIPALAELSASLKTIDSNLAGLRVTYKEDDKSIQDLLSERIFLIDLLKRQVKGFLMAQKAYAQARLKGAERPEGVLIKYRMLLSDASKDKSTLNNLENKYRMILLEKARSEDPWELITTPTLLPYPVAPKRKRILILGLLGGTFIGSGAALVSEKRKDIVFSMDEMESLGKWPLLAELSISQKQSWAESLDLVASGPLSESDGGTALIAVGEIDDSELTHLGQSLKQFLKNRELKVAKDLGEATKYPNLIVVTAMGITRKQDLIETKKKLLLQRTSVLGLIALNKIKFKT